MARFFGESVMARFFKDRTDRCFAVSGIRGMRCEGEIMIVYWAKNDTDPSTKLNVPIGTARMILHAEGLYSADEDICKFEAFGDE